MREGGTVVANEKNHGRIKQAAFFQHCENTRDGLIHAVHFAAVVRQLRAHSRKIGPVGGQGEGGGVRTVFGGGVPFMMRIAEIGPHEKRFLRRFLVEKCFQLRCHDIIRTDVEKIHSFCKGLEFIFFKEFPYLFAGIFSRAIEMITAAANAGEISRLRSEQLGQRDLVFRQWRRKAGDPRRHR